MTGPGGLPSMVGRYRFSTVTGPGMEFFRRRDTIMLGGRGERERQVSSEEHFESFS